jgi:phosphoribosylcarboxyaminoimidazole (NCAIR) mutase
MVLLNRSDAKYWDDPIPDHLDITAHVEYTSAHRTPDKVRFCQRGDGMLMQ